MTARHKPAPVRTAAGEALDATELRDLIHALGGTRSDAEMAKQRIREVRAERHRRAS